MGGGGHFFIFPNMNIEGCKALFAPFKVCCTYFFGCFFRESTSVLAGLENDFLVQNHSRILRGDTFASATPHTPLLLLSLQTPASNTFNQISTNFAFGLGAMKTAMNDIFMHDQQPVIAMITRSSP